MDYQFADRLEKFDSGIFALLDEKKKELMAKGKKIYNLSIGTPDFSPEPHGTDRALLGGTLGFQTDDLRIRDAFAIAEQEGLDYTYRIDGKTEVKHPNTADILLESADGDQLLVRGESLGGGKIRIARIDHIEVDFTGEYSTLIIRHQDKTGMVPRKLVEKNTKNLRKPES